MIMFLKPQDVLVLLKLAVRRDPPLSYGALAAELGMSASEAHGAVQRSRLAGLAARDEVRVLREPLLDFLCHGLRYVLPLQRRGIERGMPTAHAAPPLNERIVAGSELPPVWPDARGSVKGEAWEPLYRSAVIAAKKDPKLYECLALVDSLRGGRARERKLAESCLRELLASRSTPIARR